MSDGFRRRDLFTLFRRGTGDERGPEEPGSPSVPVAPAAAAPPPPHPLAVRDPLRPPGALFESIFLDTCQRCGHCVDVCPRQAIAPLDESWGGAAGTPAIVPRDAPCVVCEGLECTTVCPSGALTRLAVFDVQMGTAVLLESCVTLRGEPCAQCVVACPVPGALANPSGRPEVDAARCIGCGVCEHVCPTVTPSIVVEPARSIGLG